MSLPILLERENERRAATSPPLLLPSFVAHAFAFLREHALPTTGLFRLSANQDQLDQQHARIDAGELPSFVAPRDVHLAAALIKLYFRELPEPLVPTVVRDAIETAMAENEGDDDSLPQRIEAVAKVLADLQVIGFFLSFF